MRKKTNKELDCDFGGFFGGCNSLSIFCFRNASFYPEATAAKHYERGRKTIARHSAKKSKVMAIINYFYDLPIYRVSSEKFDRDWGEYLQTSLYSAPSGISKEYIDDFYKREPGQKSFRTQHAWKKFGGPWRYNEIIGYIRLYFLGDQIRGEYWLVRTKKVVKTRKKIIDFRDYKIVPEKTIPSNATNYKIYELVIAYIKEAKKSLKKWYVDFEDFEKIGRFIDWKSLMHA